MMLLDGSGISAIGTERGTVETPRSIRSAMRSPEAGQHRKFVDMQAGALQAFVQGAGGFAGRGFQGAQGWRRRRRSPC